MRRDLGALEAEEFDLVVIGGGMFGAAVALDATQRGLRVALVERGDFCGATSAHSFKMIHGGIRYLQHGDVKRVRQSARARAGFLRIAPHLTRPLPIVVPTYGWGMKSKPVLRVGTGLYDLLTFDRNRGIADPSRHIPNARFWSREEVVRRYPGLPRDGLTGAGVFCDGQMYNPLRLVLAFVRSAVDAGAVCANYVEAVSLLGDEHRVRGVHAIDRVSGGRLAVRGRVVVNAAGPYAEAVLTRGAGRGLLPRTPFSRDAYFIVNRPLFEGDEALTLPAATHDPDAFISRGERHLFVVPWRGATLVGVWHKVYAGDPDDYAIEEAELASWIEEVNGAYPGLHLKPGDVALGSAGLVPFGDNDPQSRHLKFAHRSRLIDHKVERNVDGFVTLIGVRYTTGPCDAVEVVDLVQRKLGTVPSPSRLETVPVDGGDIDDFEALVRTVTDALPADSAAHARSLAHNHGSAWRRLEAVIAAKGDLARPLAGSGVLRAQVALAVTDEMAMSLADIVFRRTDLCSAGNVGRAALSEAAAVAAEAAGWDPGRAAAELAFVEERLRLARSGRAFLADGAPPALAMAA